VKNLIDFGGGFGIVSSMSAKTVKIKRRQVKRNTPVRGNIPHGILHSTRAGVSFKLCKQCRQAFENASDALGWRFYTTSISLCKSCSKKFFEIY